MEEELILVCPCCSASLGIDDAGDLVAIKEPELAANQSKGLGGLKVQHSGVSPEDLRMFNQQQTKSRESLIDVPVLGNDPRAIQYEQSIVEANNADLAKRAIAPAPKKSTRTKSKK